MLFALKMEKEKAAASRLGDLMSSSKTAESGGGGDANVSGETGGPAAVEGDGTAEKPDQGGLFDSLLDKVAKREEAKGETK